MRCNLMAGLLAALIPAGSQAVQLHWSSGASNLNFTVATRCTLVVETAPSELFLPSEWQLLWTTRNCGTLQVVLDTASTDSSLAHLSDIGFGSHAEASAHVATAGFYADTPGFVTRAQYVLDLPAGSHGTFQVVAVIPADDHNEERAARSGLATFNGGVDVPLRPVVVRASSTRPTSRLTVD